MTYEIPIWDVFHGKGGSRIFIGGGGGETCARTRINQYQSLLRPGLTDRFRGLEALYTRVLNAALLCYI